MPYYTWVVPGNKSNWYNSVTLFKQKKYGVWEDIFEEIRNELVDTTKDFLKR
jgi:hypothetical protein